MFTGLSHVMMWVHDLARAITWYKEKLGCEEIFAAVPHYAALRLPEAQLRIDLHPDEDGKNVGVGPMPYLRVADLDAALQDLAARGVQVGEARSEGGARFASFRDCEGNLLGVSEG